MHQNHRRARIAEEVGTRDREGNALRPSVKVDPTKCGRLPPDICLPLCWCSTQLGGADECDNHVKDAGHPKTKQGGCKELVLCG